MLQMLTIIQCLVNSQVMRLLQELVIRFRFNVLHSLTSGINNTGVGLLALNACITGNYNTAVGVQALQNNSGGSFNTGIGLAALQNNTASNNTAVGSSSLQNNTSGTSNVGVGVQSLLQLTTGINNTCVGGFSGGNYTSSESYNICIGHPGVLAESLSNSYRSNIWCCSSSFMFYRRNKLVFQLQEAL